MILRRILLYDYYLLIRYFTTLIDVDVGIDVNLLLLYSIKSKLNQKFLD